jgi:monoamine oxidase
MFSYKALCLIISLMIFTIGVFTVATNLLAKNKNPKVVVIGAGLAGLTTAYRLQQQGMDVEIYEARDRIGGRVFSVNLAGKIVELGGHNVSDGSRAENMRRLISECGLELVTNKLELNRYYFMGEELVSIDDLIRNQQFNPETLRIKLEEVASQCNNMKEILDMFLGENDPLNKVLSVRLASYEGGSVENLSPIYIETLYYILLGGICAAHSEEELREKTIAIVSIKGGNALLPKKLAEALGNRLHCNKVLSQMTKHDDTYELTFVDGEKIYADIVVLANPCSTYNDIAFGNDLIPTQKLKAMKNIQYGANAKIFIPVSDSFVQKKRVMNESVISWFDASCGALTLYHTGELSFFSDKTIADVYKKSGSKLFEACFSDACSSQPIPTVVQDKAFACYDGAIGHSWPADPYAQGSYSYIAPGQELLLTTLQETQGERVKELFAPLNQQTLYFAGEHTSILMDVPGTMEAACESGERTARMISNS